MDKKISFINLSVGCCHFCNINQTVIGKGGLWISGTRWICDKCQTDHSIRSYPVACEWCNYNDVKWYQGHTYSCPRCIFLGIKNT